MKFSRGASRVLWYESAGFVVLIVLSWADEIEGLAQFSFGGGPHAGDWRDSALQTLVIIYTWAIVWGLTKRWSDRSHSVSKLLRLCAWCRKVGHKGKWMKVEDYFAEDFHIPTTHGMCQDCFRHAQEETAEFKRKELEAGKQTRTEEEPGHGAEGIQYGTEP
jgi:hypothetical protein